MGVAAGPEFVPMNGICRSFPQSILDLLKGDGTAGDNKLCTTLFCIGSGLKKLSQKTELPDTRCASLPTSLPQHCREAARGGKEREQEGEVRSG